MSTSENEPLAKVESEDLPALGSSPSSSDGARCGDPRHARRRDAPRYPDEAKERPDQAVPKFEMDDIKPSFTDGCRR